MNGPACRLIALHGFLGGPDDWESMSGEMTWAEIDAVDLWPLTAAAGADPWRSIGKLLDEELTERASRKPVLPAVVVAYSFGARLALAAERLAEGLLPIAAVCLVSCNPGLAGDDAAARRERREADERWARVFMESSEAEIRAAWNAQPVLSGDPTLVAGPEALARSVAHSAGLAGPLPAPRYTLAVAMRRFSLARQPDFRMRIASWRTPLLWVTGERDEKFTAIARQLQSSGAAAEIVVCKAAGHRVPWDNPVGFQSVLRGWLQGALAAGRGATE